MLFSGMWEINYCNDSTVVVVVVIVVASLHMVKFTPQ